MGKLNIKPALVQIYGLAQTGSKPLSELIQN